MNLRHTKFLASLATSALAIGVAAPALAAGQAQQASSEAPASGLKSEADSAPAGEIVVTGYRASLNNAQAVKRRATMVMEAITPQDLGKFTDASIADQLQRVPGVQIDRNSDGRAGDHVSIRGMGPEFITTSFNGRTPGGYGREGLQYLREFATDVLPSEILGGVQIYKTSTAEMPEAGLGGEVNFDTLRPLDYHVSGGGNVFGNITLKTTKNDYTNQWGKGISGAIGAKFLDDTLGIVIAGVINNNPFKRQDDEIRPGIVPVNIQPASGPVQTQSVLFPSQVLIESVRGDQKRTAATADVQWRPNDNWEVNLDYTYSRFDKPTVWDIVDLGYNSGGTFLPGGITIQNGAVTGLDYSHYIGGSGIAFAGLFPYQYRNDDKLQMGGVNIKWHDDKAFAVLDVATSRTRALMSANNAWVPINGSSIPANSVTNYLSNNSGPASANVGAPSLDAPSNWSTTFYPGQRYINARNDNTSARFDTGYKVTDNVTLKAGLRFNEATIDTRDLSGGSSATAAQLVELFGAMLPGTSDCIFAAANGTVCMPFQDPAAMAAINNAYITPINQSLAPFAGPFSTVGSTQSGTWNINASDSHANTEITKAAYAQIDFKGNAGLDFEGNAGVRVVNTIEKAQGLQSVSYVDMDSQTTRPISLGVVGQRNSYTSVLPSMNLTLHPASDMNLRFAVAKTLSRPEFEDMSPTNAIGIPDPLISTTTANSVGSARVGNINLKPQTAWNFDITAEKYTHSGGSFVASLFYKAVSDFILASAASNQTLPGFGSQEFGVVTAMNVSSGKAYGAEIGFHQPLSVFGDALDGFGIQVNYTYVNTKVDQPISGLTLPFLGASRHNANGTLYYSKGKLDARVAASYRSSYLSQVPWSATRPVYLFTEGSTTVDASISYAITPHFDVTITGSNLTKANRRDFAPNNDAFMLNYITAPRVFAIALRAKM